MTETPSRRITALDIDTAAIGLGCMGMSWAYATPGSLDDDASIAVIRGALDRGVTLIDTADAYGMGHNEELVGRAIAERRDEVILATKGGLVSSYVDGKPHLDRHASPAHLRAACDDSLRRLGVEVIDLYYLHRVDSQVPLAESWGTLSELVSAGKVRAIGLSEVTTEQADAAHQIHPVAAIQSELSLWSRDVLGSGRNADGVAVGDVVIWCRDHGANFVPFSPLGRGFLTGKLNTADLPSSDFRAGLPRFVGEAAVQNQAIVAAVQQLADRKGVPAAAVALAWVLAQGEHVVPIPGTTKLANLDANLAATRLELDEDDLLTLAQLPEAVGGRY